MLALCVRAACIVMTHVHVPLRCCTHAVCTDIASWQRHAFQHVSAYLHNLSLLLFDHSDAQLSHASGV